MKALIYFSFFLLFNSTEKDDFRFFDYNLKPNWHKWEKGVVTPEFLKTNFQYIKDKPFKEIDQALRNIDMFHFIDVDGDQNNELVYNGWTGGEGEMITIYKIQGNTLIEQQTLMGRICDIRKNESNHTRLIVYDYSCCAGYVDHVETFDYHKSEHQFKIIKSVANVSKTTFPEKWIEPIRFKINQTPYNLRYSHEIITGLKKGFMEFDPIKGENIIAVYKAGDLGTAYAEKTDSTGRIWWFVMMDKKPDSGESIFYDGNNDFPNYQPVGWLSSRYVEKIK